MFCWTPLIFRIESGLPLTKQLIEVGGVGVKGCTYRASIPQRGCTDSTFDRSTIWTLVTRRLRGVEHFCPMKRLKNRCLVHVELTETAVLTSNVSYRYNYGAQDVKEGMGWGLLKVVCVQSQSHRYIRRGSQVNCTYPVYFGNCTAQTYPCAYLELEILPYREFLWQGSLQIAWRRRRRSILRVRLLSGSHHRPSFPNLADSNSMTPAHGRTPVECSQVCQDASFFCCRNTKAGRGVDTRMRCVPVMRDQLICSCLM